MDYSPFTTEFDLECTAAELAADPEKRDDGNYADAHWSSTAYPATMRDEWLRKHASWPGWDRVSVTLLVDHSGSMRDGAIVRAAAAARVFAAVLSELGVSFEILGFTTRSWKGGQSRQKWLASGKPARPGRLCDVLHLVYGGRGGLVEDELRLMLNLNVLRENVDGEAVQWAVSRLELRHEPIKLLIVVSDGAPSDDSTIAENGQWFLEAHLAAVLDDVAQRSAVRIAAINVRGASSTPTYPNTRDGALPEAAQEALLGLLADLTS